MRRLLIGSFRGGPLIFRTAQPVAEKVPIDAEIFPQRLKPDPFRTGYGTAEAVPLQIPRTAEKMKCRSIRLAAESFCRAKKRRDELGKLAQDDRVFALIESCGDISDGPLRPLPARLSGSLVMVTPPPACLCRSARHTRTACGGRG